MAILAMNITGRMPLLQRAGRPRHFHCMAILAINITAGWRMASAAMRLAILAAGADTFYGFIEGCQIDRVPRRLGSDEVAAVWLPQRHLTWQQR